MKNKHVYGLIEPNNESSLIVLRNVINKTIYTPLFVIVYNNTANTVMIFKNVKIAKFLCIKKFSNKHCINMKIKNNALKFKNNSKPVNIDYDYVSSVKNRIEYNYFCLNFTKYSTNMLIVMLNNFYFNWVRKSLEGEANITKSFPFSGLLHSMVHCMMNDKDVLLMFDLIIKHNWLQNYNIAIGMPEESDRSIANELRKNIQYTYYATELLLTRYRKVFEMFATRFNYTISKNNYFTFNKTAIVNIYAFYDEQYFSDSDVSYDSEISYDSDD
ncbi:unknown [Euproctis pseudoconspersa nucleopolyhedrovirus]|uniref:Uncharacterized protein n=1 Tax=Euproctis pseudoconspersa nucleopolyhedrovirus TaxID=307467 RepID=C3TWS7_9ABAC|nr:hypothetical protein EupsNPV_gp019 [Euproctis pseudoconspersa nucleopolyhedrovirus]ACO53469.1 unknown [Euproctis pseudoconspersa nucleopolyhedrovirus]QUJ09212.1 hypothetical protein Gyru_ORF17 [Gynaephora ruoergensis nucleopolyhedrovirus]